MTTRRLLATTTTEVPCTVEIEHTADSLHAHVDLDSGIEIGPGDEVRVLGAAVDVAFGDKLTLRRRAMVTQASLLGALWTKLTARFELTELYDVSFSSWRRL